MRMTLTPPVIPPFMANVVQLAPIEGLPSDEEVKKVLHAIRLVTELMNGHFEMPENKNEDLMMELSQHLFEVQMVLTTCGAYQDTVTYTPPSLPEIFQIQLEAIKGAPSDKQIQSVQAALRKSELTAKIPPMFDADLNMKLSQHLFDIQFERYRRQVASPHAAASVIDAAGQGFETPSLLGSEVGSEVESEVGSEAGTDPDADSPQDANHPERRSTHHEHNVSTVEPTPSASDVRQLSGLLKELILGARAAVHAENQPADPVERTHESVSTAVKTGFEETNKTLVKICDGLEKIGRIMVGTQHNAARAINRSYYGHNSPFSYPRHPLINAKGETPEFTVLPGLPNITGDPSSYSAYRDIMAQYLCFYDIGRELIQEGDEPTVKEDKVVEAVQALREYFRA
ncbi:hypothetical protein FRC09_009454 [Ceratobasidium sp. 395]|nr:hypothetical protein FRC09_009454 [Ceratobasidium sp. 395]